MKKMVLLILFMALLYPMDSEAETIGELLATMNKTAGEKNKSEQFEYFFDLPQHNCRKPLRMKRVQVSKMFPTPWVYRFEMSLTDLDAAAASTEKDWAYSVKLPCKNRRRCVLNTFRSQDKYGPTKSKPKKSDSLYVRFNTRSNQQAFLAAFKALVRRCHN